MIFVYFLALIGLAVLIAGCYLAYLLLSDQLNEPSDPDVYDEALGAVAGLQGAAWEAAQAIRQAGAERES